MHFKSLQDFQRHIESFSDPAEQRIAEATPFFADASSTDRKHIVVLLHGMNTNAEWQEAMAEAIRNSGSIEPLVVGYGNFNPIKFWLPFFFRRQRIKKVLTDLRGIRARHPDANISIVAHSFGTFILSKILDKCRDINFHRILLCGSIVDTDYDWSAVMTQFSHPVINDIGRRDIWPSMAKSWTWGFGNSGCIGFQNSLVRDRHFTYGHSGFLNKIHMRKFWLPYLLDGHVISSRYTTLRKPMRWGELLLRSLSWRHALLILVIFLTFHYWPFFHYIDLINFWNGHATMFSPMKTRA